MPCNFLWRELPKEIVKEVVEPLKDNLPVSSYKKYKNLLWRNLPLVLNDFFLELKSLFPECVTITKKDFIWRQLEEKASILCQIKDAILNCEEETLLIEVEEDLIQFFLRDTETYTNYFSALSLVTINGESALEDDRIEVEQITPSSNWTILSNGVINFIGSGSTAETLEVRVYQISKPDNFIIFDVFLDMRNNESRVTAINPVNICENNLEAEVTITGQFFTSLTGIPYVTDVLFNEESAESFTIVNSTTITAVPPLTVTSGIVEIVSDQVRTSTTAYNIQKPITLPSITGDSEVCSGKDLQLEIAFAGNLWSSSDEDIATVDGNGLVTGVSEGTATISFSVTNLGCTSTTSTEITVFAQPEITLQPSSSYTILEGENRTISVDAEGTNLSYQWYFYDLVEDDYVPLVASSVISGVNTNTLSITNADSSVNGLEVLCRVSGESLCDNVDSNVSILTVGDVGILQDLSNVTVCENEEAVFTVEAEGDVQNYIWYIDQGLGLELVSDYTGDLIITGNGTNTLSVDNISLANNGFSFVVQIESSTNTYNSNAAQLIVNEC